MTALLACCLTVVAVAVIVARTILERDARRQRLHHEIAMHERATAASTATLADAVAALTAAASDLQQAREQRGPSRVGQRVTVHGKQPDDLTWYGVVDAEYADRIVLKDAELVTPKGAQPLPGHQNIDHEVISWIDAHGHVELPDTVPAEA